MPKDEYGNSSRVQGDHRPNEGNGFESAETIDLSRWFTKDLTLSGSFNLSGVGNTTLGRLLNAIPVPTGLIGNDYRFTFCNEAWQKLSGETLKMEGKSLLGIFPLPQDAGAVKSTVDKVYKERKSLVQENRILLADRTIWVRLYFRPLRLGDDRVALMTVENLTLEREQIRLLRAIERAKREWEQSVDSVSELIAIVDDQFRILRANKAMSVRTGIPIKEVVGKHCFQLIHGTESPPAHCPLVRTLPDGGETSEEYYEPRACAFLKETASPIRGDSSGFTARVITLRDVTEQKKAEEDLRNRANSDELTGLFNRRHVREMLVQVGESAKRYGQPLGVALLDLDNLKRVNDQHGHEGGDLILRRVGSVIRDHLRSSDFAGRYGGDEFVIVFPHTPIAGAANCVARILAAMNAEPFRVGAQAHTVSCSAGISDFAPPDTTLDDLIRRADRALYAAKKGGGNRIVINQEDELVPMEQAWPSKRPTDDV